MSLIQDALKRQQEEMTKKTGAASPDDASPVPVKTLGKLDTPGIPTPTLAQPKIPLRMMGQPPVAEKQAPPESPPASHAVPTPPPLQPDTLKPDYHRVSGETSAQEDRTSRHEPESEKRRPIVLIAAFAALILLLAGGLYWFWPSLTGKTAPGTTALQSTVPSPQPAIDPLSPALSTGMPGSGTLAQVETSATGMNAIVSTAEAITNPAVALLTPAGSPSPDPLADSLLPDASPALFAPPPPRAAAAAPAVWPPIKLTGMVKLGATAAALINGRVVAPGDTIEDVVLVTVNKDGALLRYQSEERLLRVGETAR
jgi:hypothetical protein